MTPGETQTAAARGYVEALRFNMAFRRIWFGEVVSSFGDWFNLVASASLVASLTGSGSAVGALFVIRMLAPFLVSPLAGVLADRHNRRRIMIASDLARAVVVAGFLLVREPGEIWLLYVLTALQLGLSAFFVPARTAILPEILSTRDIGVANALSSATYAITQALGAGFGGLLAGTLGVYQTFLVDAASFLLSAAALSLAAYRPARRNVASRRPTLSRQYADGLRYLRGDRETLFLTMHKGVNSMVITGGLNVVVVTIAEDHFPLGQGAGFGLGLMFCATGVGTALGPVISRRFTGDRIAALRRGLVACYLISALGLALVAPVVSLAMVIAGLVVRGVGGGMMFVCSTQLLMMRVPNDVRGRVFSTEFALRTLLNAVGTMAISLGLDTALGTVGVLWVMTGLAVVPGLLWWLWTIAVAEPAAAPSWPELGAAADG